MALQAVAAVFAPETMKCYAGCDKPDYQDLVVTKCHHIFCRSCLKQSLTRNNACPSDRTDLLDMDSEEGKKEYTSFQLYLQRFTHYIIRDPTTLKQRLAAEKALRITSCELLKADKAQKKNSSAKEGTGSEDHCPICLDIPFQMYFIMSDKDSNKVGRHMHGDCWQETIANESFFLDISVQDLVRVAKNLPELPPEPIKPPSPVKVYFIAIIPLMSIWALAMNTLVYRNMNTLLFVLSIPALITLKILSLLLNGLKTLLTDKPA